jgi:hypothetical protein
MFSIHLSRLLHKAAGVNLTGLMSIVMLTIFFSIAASAQVTTGQISGTVEDASGAALPGVIVTVIDLQTSLRRTATSDSSGFYLVSNLPPGNYRVRVEQNGFKTWDQSNIPLNAGDRVSINPELQIGAVSETVTISATGEKVETDNGSVGQLIDGNQVRDLSLNGRNLMTLLMIVPGVAVTTDEFDRGGMTYGSIGNYNINGLRATSNSVTVDGGYNQDSGNITSLTNNVSVDFVGEVKIASSAYSAEYGRTGGAQVNFSTRRGTSEYHGTLWEFFRNDKLNSRGFFSPQTEKLRLNNFGWNFGGPVMWPGKFNSDRRKLFVFGGQEYKRRVDASTRRVTFPTLAERSGIPNVSATTVLRYPANFHIVSLRGQQISDPSRGTATNPQGLYILPKQYLTANGAAIMKIFDVMQQQSLLYSDTATANNVTFQLDNRDIRREDLVRLDYIPSQRNEFSFRYLFDTGSNSVPYETGDIPTYRATRRNKARNLQFTWTTIIGPRTTNELSGVSTYLFLERFPYDDFRFPKTYGLNIRELYGDDMNVYGIPPIAIAGFTTISGARGNSHSPLWDGSIRDNFSHLIGKHNLKTGGIFLHNRKNERVGGTLVGDLSFQTGGNSNTTGNALLDALLGNYRQYREGDNDKFSYTRYNQIEAYVADTWKARPNLTLDIGVRYTHLGAPFETGNTLSTFVPGAYDPSRAQMVVRTGSTAGELTPGVGVPFNGIVVGGDEFTESHRLPLNPAGNNLFRGLSRSLMDSQDKFSPRFGFSWDPLSKGDFVVRGGGAVYYDRLSLIAVTAGGNPPFQNVITIFNGSVDNLTNGRQASFPVAVTSINPNAVFPTTYNWNLGVQKKLPFDALLDVNYVSTQGRHLLRRPDINQVTPAVQSSNSSININALRRYQGYTNIRLYESSAASNYHALQVGLTRRYSKDLTFSLAYTWSKVLTDASGQDDGVEDLSNYAAERSHASFDRNHILTASYVYNIPFFRTQEGFVGKILGGWQLSGIIQAQSGQWLSASINTPTGGRRPDLVGKVTYLDPRQVQTLTGGTNTPVTGNFYFDPTPGKIFAVPAADRYGSSPPNVIQGPGRHNWDMSLFKNIKATEKINVQFRAEAFNVWNHASFRNPNMNASSRDFGTISAAGYPRLIQFAIKLMY